MAIRITGEISESELVPSTKVEGIHIVLKAPGANKALVIQYIAEAIGGDMKQAQQWVGKAPLILPIPFSGMEEAQVLAEKLAIAGAGISVNL